MDVCLAVEYIHKPLLVSGLLFGVILVFDLSSFFFLYSVVYLAVSNLQWMLSVGRRDSQYTRISRMPLRCKLCSAECSAECCPVLSYLLFGNPSPGISHRAQSAHCCLPSAENSLAASPQTCLKPNPHSEFWYEVFVLWYVKVTCLVGLSALEEHVIMGRVRFFLGILLGVVNHTSPRVSLTQLFLVGSSCRMLVCMSTSSHTSSQGVGLGVCLLW